MRDLAILLKVLPAGCPHIGAASSALKHWRTSICQLDLAGFAPAHAVLCDQRKGVRYGLQDFTCRPDHWTWPAACLTAGQVTCSFLVAGWCQHKVCPVAWRRCTLMFYF
jgi:hypothetical protein